MNDSTTTIHSISKRQHRILLSAACANARAWMKLKAWHVPYVAAVHSYGLVFHARPLAHTGGKLAWDR